MKDGTENNMGYYIELEFTKTGKQRFKEATSQISKIAEPNNYISVVLDDNVLSAPKVTQAINSGTCIITGDFNQETATNIVNTIKAAIDCDKYKINRLHS